MSLKNIYIKQLPFYWRVRENSDSPNIVPDFQPFETSFDVHLSLLIQKREKRVLKYLEKIYQEKPNIGHNQEISNWSKFYGKDFIDFIENAISQYGRRKRIKRILEIGCGGCLLLAQLKKRGFKVVGIDPSPFAQKEGKKRGIEVIRDFFPSEKIKGKFDLIFHSNVLEHVADPVEFLKFQFELMTDNAILILAVPDCTQSILSGDISMFYHQHLSYFDSDSLNDTVVSAGFDVIKITRADFGGNLYCFARKVDKIKRASISLRNNNDAKYKNFLRRYPTIRSKMNKLIKHVVASKNNTLGFYAPLRALPYIAVMNLEKGFRFFDDTSYWHRKYFDGVNVPIENFEDLKRNPVTDLIIMSPTFGDLIEKKVISHFTNKIETKKLTDFFV